jgi:hypothetical protein
VRRETVDAGPELAGSLGGEILADTAGLSHRTDGAAKGDDRTGTQPEPVLGARSGAVAAVIEQAPTGEGSSAAGRSVLPGEEQPEWARASSAKRPQRPPNRSLRH